jgi:hypothetical protein
MNNYASIVSATPKGFGISNAICWEQVCTPQSSHQPVRVGVYLEDFFQEPNESKRHEIIRNLFKNYH